MYGSGREDLKAEIPVPPTNLRLLVGGAGDSKCAGCIEDDVNTAGDVGGRCDTVVAAIKRAAAALPCAMPSSGASAGKGSVDDTLVQPWPAGIWPADQDQLLFPPAVPLMLLLLLGMPKVVVVVVAAE